MSARPELRLVVGARYRTFEEDGLQRLELIEVDLLELLVGIEHGHSFAALHTDRYDLRTDIAVLSDTLGLIICSLELTFHAAADRL